MTRNDTLQEAVATLISRRAEGAYWDFKRCHHKNNFELIHDILCLANARHQGSRFLIFGVDDEDFSLHSISSDTGRRTQAAIASLFRDNANKFFQSRFPEFYLTELSIDGALIDVLVVEDTSHKPYYLIERYGKFPLITSIHGCVTLTCLGRMLHNLMKSNECGGNVSVWICRLSKGSNFI